MTEQDALREELDREDLDALQLLQTLQTKSPLTRIISGVNESNGRARFDILMDGEWHQLYVIPVRFASRNCIKCHARVPEVPCAKCGNPSNTGVCFMCEN